MPRSAPGEIERLRRDVERASRSPRRGGCPPLLARLARAARPRATWIFAHRHLAEIGVEHDPWRAALFARRVIARRPRTTAPGPCSACRSRSSATITTPRAPASAPSAGPDSPWYTHNLGHLARRALDRPAEALPLLERATAAQPSEADIAASYAHALARCGTPAAGEARAQRAIRRRRHGRSDGAVALARSRRARALAATGGHSAPEPRRLGHRRARRRPKAILPPAARRSRSAAARAPSAASATDSSTSPSANAEASTALRTLGIPSSVPRRSRLRNVFVGVRREGPSAARALVPDRDTTRVRNHDTASDPPFHRSVGACLSFAERPSNSPMLQSRSVIGLDRSRGPRALPGVEPRCRAAEAARAEAAAAPAQPPAAPARRRRSRSPRPSR